MASLLSPERPRPSVLVVFLLLSLLLHLGLLLWLRGAKLSVEAPGPLPIVVKLAPEPAPAPDVPPDALASRKAPAPPAAAQAAAQPPPGAPPAPAVPAPPPETQIVAPSDRENELPPLGRAYLSDRDNRVEQQTVKRGNPDAGEQSPPPEPPTAVASAPQRAPKPPPPAVAPRRVPPAAASRAAAAPPGPAPDSRRPGATIADDRPLPGLEQLLAPPAEVLASAGPPGSAASPEGAQAEPAGDPRQNPHRDLLGAPPPAPGFLGGLRGTFDSLPDVAQGSMTMLNTKADRFAPFVRRVGTRVFQNMLIYQRRDLDAQEILAAHEAITVRVILDRAGKLKSLDVEERSGSLAVDQTLLEALRQAAFDQNPPSSAANPNGEYEFVFQAQLAAVVAAGPSGPQVQAVESRLRVGLL